MAYQGIGFALALSAATAKQNSSAEHGYSAFRWVGVFVFALCCLFVAEAQAALERYDYDALGRVIRYVDPSGRITQYVYDGAGNILSVRATVPVPAPSVSAINPAGLRRGGSQTFTVTGTNLTNATVTLSGPANPELTLSALVVTPTQISFTLSATANALIGIQSLSITTPGGLTATQVNVLPTLPVMTVEPTPLAIPPDNVARDFAVVLSGVDSLDHVLTATTDQTAIATLSPTSTSVAAGQTRAMFQIRGVTGGQTILRIASPGLAPIAIPVFVTAEFRGLSTAYTLPLGVQVGTGSTSAGGFSSSLASPLLGVNVGSLVTGVNPNTLVAGITSTLTISGVAIPANTTFNIVPPDGTTINAATVAVDGGSATLQVSVAADAQKTLRRIVAVSGGKTLPVSGLNADRFAITFPLPEILSVSPIFGLPGQTLNPFIVRGRNLFGATGLSFSGAGLTAGSSPVVNGDGTQLTTSVYVVSNASPGTRSVVVLTPGQSSTPMATPSNTFTVVSDAGINYDPLLAPLLGVGVGTTIATGFASSLSSIPVGVLVGTGLTSIVPSNASRGSMTSITVTGQGLNVLTAAAIVPATDISIGSLVVAPDGLSATLSMTVDANAVLGARQLRLFAGTTAVPFTGSTPGALAITAPMPALISVDPSIVAIGSTGVTFTARGVNFQGATALRVTPSTGVTVSPPQVAIDGTIAVATISVASNAAVGPRLLTVVTPSGETSSTADATNTLSLVSGDPFTGWLTAPVVGINVGEANAGGPFAGTLASSLVGVNIAIPPVPNTSTYGLISAHVGVNVGPVIAAMTPRSVVTGGAVSVTLTGVAIPLSAVVSAQPATDLTLGPSNVSADGSSVTVTVTASASAATGLRRLVVANGGSELSISPQNATQLVVNAGEPTIASISPILARQGETIIMVIRGTRLQDIESITAAPAAGLVFDTQPTASADGTELTTRIFVETSAPLGGRVIRVKTAGGQTTSIAAPANTFTVYSP